MTGAGDAGAATGSELVSDPALGATSGGGGPADVVVVLGEGSNAALAPRLVSTM
jgi:hypothetical protein